MEYCQETDTSIALTDCKSICEIFSGLLVFKHSSGAYARSI